MPAGGYVSDYLLHWYVAATLAVFALGAWRGERRRVAALLGGTLALAVLVLAGETYFRYVVDTSNDALPTLTSRAWYMRHWNPEQNAHGFRGRDWTETPPARGSRTIVLGDDVVAGFGIADPRDCVAALLDARHDDIDVIGAGKPNWHTGDELNWLAQSGATLGAGRVLVLYSADDAVDLLPPDTRLDVQSISDTRSSTVNPARSFLLDAWWYRSLMRDSPWWRDRVQLRSETTLRRHQERMHRIATVCAQIGAPLDVAVLPWPGDGESERAHTTLAREMWLRAGARHVVDLSSKVDVEERVSRWAPWPDEEAHASLADVLSTQFFE